MLVVNLTGGPGAGKSTMAAKIFALLKAAGYKAELTGEVAKDMIYEGRQHKLNNQFLVSAMQYTRIRNLQEAGCDVAISDSPLWLQMYYGRVWGVPYIDELKALVRRVNDEFTNYNVQVIRQYKYQSHGRLQNELEATRMSCDIAFQCGPYDVAVHGTDTGAAEVVAKVAIKLHEMGIK